MKLTNRFGLPQTLINAVERDDYTMGEARMSVTGLLKPPRIGILFKKHANEIEKDVTDHIWSIFGRAVHKILEHGGDEQHIPEERLFAEVRGWIISGQLDLQMLGPKKIKITDYKTTSSYAVMHSKPEWEQQLNVYKWLAKEANGYETEALSVCAFIRNWDRHQAKQNPDYPQAPTIMIPINMWDHKIATTFVEGRVRIHQEALASTDMGDEPPLCTDEERWMRTPTYAVWKHGNKRASKTFDSAPLATEYAAERGKEFYVETRPANPVRCEGDYCNVSQWCRQYREWQDAQKPTL